MSWKIIVGWAGIAVCILSVFLGLWVGLWVCLVGGVMDVVNGFGAEPWKAMQVGVGVLKFLCSGIIGWIAFGLGLATGIQIIEVSDNMENVPIFEPKEEEDE